MSQPGDIREAAATALGTVAGLRAYAKPPGNVAPPVALVQHNRITTGVVLGGGADYQLRVVLLVQLGEFRNAQERVEDLIDPAGTAVSSAVVALLADTRFGQVIIDDFGELDYGGTTYAGAILNVDAIG